MSRPNILMLLDIDGVLVESLPEIDKSPAQYAEQIKDQPLNKGIYDYIQKWYEDTAANIKLHIVTKRKASLLQTTTDIQLFAIKYYIEKIHYYPEEFHYGEPYIYGWKNDVFYDLIQNGTWDQVIIVDSNINQLTHLTFSLRVLQYWLVLQNEFIVKSDRILQLKGNA